MDLFKYSLYGRVDPATGWMGIYSVPEIIADLGTIKVRVYNMKIESHAISLVSDEPNQIYYLRGNLK